MNSIVNHMGKYDHRQHVLSDWLAELEQRFQLGEVNTDKAIITWCQLLIGATRSSIIAGLEDDASWEVAKETLLSRLGVDSVRDETWAALKQFRQGSKEIVELAGEAEKLAKRLHPRDDEAAERHAIDAFLGAINRSLVAEVQKLGCCTMEEVVVAARRIERILGEQPDSKIEQIVLSMQDQIRILTKDLQKAHEQMASQATGATPTAALAVPPAVTVACDGQCSPASNRSATTASYRTTAPLLTWQPVVSRLQGRRPLFSASTPTARQETSTLLPMRRGGSFCLSLPRSLLAAALIAATSPRNRPWPTQRSGS